MDAVDWIVPLCLGDSHRGFQMLDADVAAQLGYEPGDPIVVAHGLASFTLHDDKPFRVAGILAKTDTPVDRTVHVNLEGIEAVHVDGQGGARIAGATVTTYTG